MVTTADPPAAGAEGTIDADTVRELVAQTLGICGGERVLTRPHDLRTYQSDWLLHYRVVLSPPGWELCCGSAGVYNLLQPEAAAELGRRKAANLTGTSPDALRGK